MNYPYDLTERFTSAREYLSELNHRLTNTGAPWWGSWLASVVGFGLYLRDTTHVLVALASDRPPQLRDHDITARSPVESLDDHPRVDAVARVAVFSLGVACLGAAGNAERPLFLWFLVANAMVLLADPLLFVASLTDNGHQ